MVITCMLEVFGHVCTAVYISYTCIYVYVSQSLVCKARSCNSQDIDAVARPLVHPVARPSTSFGIPMHNARFTHAVDLTISLES